MIGLLLLVACASPEPVVAPEGLSDLRPPSLRSGITSEQSERGQVLLAEAQRVWGIEAWQRSTSAEFTMTADWKVPDSGWPGNPQKFDLRAERLGTDDAEITFLDGPEQGRGWAQKGDRHFDVAGGQRTSKSEPDSHNKVKVKNWWFQFPFRIGEADIIADAGEEEVDGKRYRRLFATWESAEPNPTFDQYLLYLDPATFDLEWLTFTHRKRSLDRIISMELLDHRDVDGMRLPHRTIVGPGAAGATAFVVHENVYHSIRFERQ